MSPFIMVAASAPNVWTQRISAAANSLIGILLFGLVLMLLLLFGHYVVADIRMRDRTAIKRSLLEAVSQYRKAATPKEAAAVQVQSPAALCSRRGIAVLTQTADGLDDDSRAALRAVLLNMGFAKRLDEELNSSNETYLAEIISLVGDLDLIGLDSRIAALMYTHKNNVDLQFQAFLTLSRLGSRDYIMRVCMDKNFVQSLSFRSLQQVLTSYNGDRTDLYAQLLSAPDPYLVRIAIKQAGLSGFVSLADQVMPWLSSDNYNIQIDAVRTLGLLRYTPAAMQIAPLLRHERWEVRSVAVTAVAAIDVDAFAGQLLHALQDSEWQVRYNAALALQQLPNQAQVKEKVAATGDRFALEMYEYMAHTASLWRKAQ